MTRLHNILLTALVPLVAMAMGAQAKDYRTAGTYHPAGKNIEAHTYQHEAEFPPFPDRVAFVGELRGSWLDMGRQLGPRN